MSFVYAEDVEVVIPEFDVVIHNQVIEKTSTYPVFMYKGITYIPLTSDFVEGLGLSLRFDGSLHLTQIKPNAFRQVFTQGNYEVDDRIFAETVPFKVFHKGPVTDQYPILFYKDITYLPLTWSLAHNQLNWAYRFDGDLYINSDDKDLLDLERVIFSPGVKSDSVGMSFTLGEYYDDLVCEVNGSIYDLDVDKINVKENDTYNYSYRTSFDGLVADTTYQVSISNDYKFYTSHFKTLASAESRVAFIGDIQGYKKSNYDDYKNTLNHVDDFDVDLIYLAGDIVDTGDVWQQWRFFEEAMINRNDLLITAVGNHDLMGSADIYEKSFLYPENGLIKNRNFYIDLEFARLAVWDTESYGTFDEQSQWLKNVMATDKFKIVLMHRSVYPVSYNESHIRALHQIFDATDIDLVLSGHDHIYSRTRMKDGQHAHDGTVYIVGGSGSGSKYYDKTDNRTWTDFIFDDNKPVYTIIDISADVIHIKAYTENVLIDQITIGE